MYESCRPVQLRRGTGHHEVFFWVTGLGLIKDFRPVTRLTSNKSVPSPGLLLGLTIAAWTIGGASLIFHRYSLQGFALLILLTLIITSVIHNFWSAPPELRATEIQQFTKKLVIVAGLLAIAALDTARP